MGEIRSLRLWDACVWAYHKQRTHVLLKYAGQAFDWALAVAGAQEDGPRPKVHWDAAMIHGAVCEIGDRHGPDVMDAIVWPASIAERPTLPDTAPRPYPVETDGARRWGALLGDDDDEASKVIYLDDPPSRKHPAMERVGRGVFEGRRIEVLVRTVGFGIDFKARYGSVGRNKLKEVERVPVWRPVEWCPLQWEPDPGWHAAAIGTYVEWRRAMGLLWDALKDTSLRDHRIEPDDIPPAPVVPVLEMDCTAYALAPLEVTLEKVKRGEVAVHLFSDGETRDVVEVIAAVRLRARVGRRKVSGASR